MPFPKQTMLGADDAVENVSSILLPADVTASAGGNTQIMVEEDSITSSVQYCCDGCSTVPIPRRRWHCTVCPDFDLCEACYEVLDADRLPPPHSRDHPIFAIPIEVETLGGEGNEFYLTTDDFSDSSLLPNAAEVNNQSSAPSIHMLEPNESEEFSTSVIDPVTISASKRAVNSLLISELLEQMKGWMETSYGVRAIPVMQLFYRLSSAVGGPFVDSSKPESSNFEKLVKMVFGWVNLNKPFAAKTRSSFGEQLVHVFKSQTDSFDNGNGANPGSGCGALLTVRRELPVEKHDKAVEKEKASKISSGKDLKLDGYQDDMNHALQKAEAGDTGTSLNKSGVQALEFKKKKKGEGGGESGLEKSYLDMEAAVDIFIAKGGDTLRQFIDCFLLEWNSSSVRSEAKCVLYGF
ncbi:hypothetical protein RHMOL_Rhmol05G0178000 [Rhododendron molle]|uniref:Uncharacterized protein n=1 Tax=Rhododendron molle TaxID=49168 RepID=A0ACC0NQ64_RHOML|nr:hypothetical protein RHMOL_Rhmol05G0178000 [Rhododendron molle]